MELENVRNVTVLGTGMMGPGIALLFARAGYATTIWGPNEQEVEKGKANLVRNVEDMVREGFMSEDQGKSVVATTTVTADLEQAGAEADFVSEAVLEVLELKQDIFAQLDKACPPKTIITSNTSTLMPSDLCAKMTNKSRMLVAHFWNPAHLVPLVEVCGHADTAPEAVEVTMGLLKKIGNEPVHIKKEILGFIGNRVMHAMNREALALVSEGVCTPEDVDKVVQTSFGPRFANLGLLEYLDFCGLDHIQRIQKYLYGDLDATPGPLPVIDRKVEAGELGCKTDKGLFDWSNRDKDGPRKRRDQEFVRRMKEKR